MSGLVHDRLADSAIISFIVARRMVKVDIHTSHSLFSELTPLAVGPGSQSTTTKMELRNQYFVLVWMSIPPYWDNNWSFIKPSRCPIVPQMFLYMLLYLIPDQNNLEMLFLILPQAFHSQSRLLQHFDPGLPRLLWALTASNVSLCTRIQGVLGCWPKASGTSEIDLRDQPGSKIGLYQSLESII